MRFIVKIQTVLSVLCVASLPLLATGNYAITETESLGRMVNPLDIMSGRERRITHGNRHKTKDRTKISKRKNPTRKTDPIYKNSKKMIYLSFDDGPGQGTANVMKVLREEGVEATMFFIGRRIRNNRALYTQALSAPNLLVANHTYTHANGKYASFYSSSARVINDIDRAQALIGGAKYLRLAGRNVWRLPQINRNDYALSKARRVIESPKYDALKNRGYQIYGWDIEWHFNHTTGNPSYGADRMASRIAAQYKRGHLTKSGKMVLLAHDHMFRTQNSMQALRELIQILKAGGWTFETIDSFSQSTPAVLVRKKVTTPHKKVIHIAMSNNNSTQTEKQKSILRMLR